MSRNKNAAQKRLNRVREAFCAEDLIRICTQTDFSSYAPKIELEPDTRSWRGRDAERFYYYRDNGSPILAVAHLDHVQEDGTCRVINTNAGPLAVSGALDDRLGAYVILELLPRLGIKVDWLLTTNEEMGASTASDFYTEKNYNWLIEFDRGGTDVVMYDYETAELNKLVAAVGARVGDGSYSDIADLEHLGCAGFNWGVGYYDYHTQRAHAWLEDTFLMVSRFMRFYAKNAATHLKHEKRDRFARYEFLTGNSWKPTTGWSEQKECPVCKSDLDKWGTCFNCGYDEDVVGLQETLKKRSEEQRDEDQQKEA